MDKITASFAKQHLGKLLELAATGPVGIERHGKLVAAVVPPGWLHRDPEIDERRRARELQQQVEARRLLAHHRIGIELLGDAARRRSLLAAARREVQRWDDENLCSADYIDRWTAWLALPAARLVERMCGDADGWGRAMRQNSPFVTAAG